MSHFSKVVFLSFVFILMGFYGPSISYSGSVDFNRSGGSSNLSSSNFRTMKKSFKRCLKAANRTSTYVDDAKCYYNSGLYINKSVSITSSATVGIPFVPGISALKVNCSASIDGASIIGALNASEGQYKQYLYDHAMVSSTPCLYIWTPTGTFCFDAFTAGPSLHGAGDGTNNFHGLGILVGAGLSTDGSLACDGGWGLPGGSSGGGNAKSSASMPNTQEDMALKYIQAALAPVKSKTTH